MERGPGGAPSSTPSDGSPGGTGAAAPLVIEVEGGETRFRMRYAFLRSPVGIGRAADNEIVLSHPFVSGRHGLIEFDDLRAWYTDLGSRNGSVRAGGALRAGERVLLEGGAEIRIGPLRLSISRAARGQVADSAEDDEAVAPGKVTALLQKLARAPAPESREVWAESLRPGLVVGRFELIREIGRGGFGVVYEALDRDLRRVIAFKAARPGLCAEAKRGEEWLQREAETAARLAHPNIVSLYDVGTWKGGPYLIMELLRGETLRQRLKRGALPLDAALDVSIQVAQALAHAHGAGVAHRDVKPANVFLCDDGRVRVLDFGLARILGCAGEKGGGTPGYVAPEQERGEVSDGRSDVFSAAVVLCETLMGRPRGDVAGGEGAGDGGDALSDGGLAAIPRDLATLLERATSADPAARPQDGRAWLKALLAAQRDIGRSAARMEHRSEAARGRRAGSGALAAAAILGAVAGAAGALLFVR